MTDPGARWDGRYAAVESPEPGEPAPFLLEVERHLPSAGTALDVGGGLGANARWLASHGLTTTLLDVSPVGLDLARGFDPEGRLRYLHRDVEADGLPPGRWDVILFHLFYDRSVVESAVDHLEPRGVLLVCQPTAVNLDRHPRPSRRFLLDTGEVHELAAGLVGDGLELIEAGEAWRSSGRHDARLVMRRRSP